MLQTLDSQSIFISTLRRIGELNLNTLMRDARSGLSKWLLE
jgi:hypothetical protein